MTDGRLPSETTLQSGDLIEFRRGGGLKDIEWTDLSSSLTQNRSKDVTD